MGFGRARLKLAFAGSPDFAAIVLAALAQSSHPCQLVLTQPDRPRGRGRKLAPSPVKTLAETLGITILQPVTLRDPDAIQALKAFAPDVLIVAAYGLLLPSSVLEIPRLGCINVHASLLPRWRGAAPIERAVMAGDPETGVAIMQMEQGLDTGPVFASAPVVIEACQDVWILEQALAECGATLLIDVLTQFHSGPIPQPVPQPTSGITYAHKLTAADRLIDWQGDADATARQIWALSHRMPAISNIGTTQVQILEANAIETDQSSQITGVPGRQIETGRKEIIIECGTGLLRILKLKINRGKGLPMDAAVARNGYPDLFHTDAVFSA